MMIRRAQVTQVLRSHPHQVLHCQITQAPPTLDDISKSFGVGCECRAIAYLDLLGEVQIGDVVQIEVSALAKSLGTGGMALVLANESRLPADSLPQPGHLIKARYTPWQKMVLGTDEQDSAYHQLLQDAESIEGLPVLVADLHSALPAIVAGYRHHRPEATLVYIHTDDAALPLSYSRTVADLKSAGWLEATITCGQSYGGDYEAVNLASALLMAHLILHADAVIVSQGPGNLGTGTRWGFSGLSVADYLRTVTALAGTPIGVLRMSSADTRPRHFGISQHSLTALLWTGLPPLDVVLPIFDASNQAERELCGQDSSFAPLVASQASLLAEHHRVRLYSTEGLWEELEAAPLQLSTMGRSLADDPAAFLAAGAAGAYCAQLTDGTHLLQ